MAEGDERLWRRKSGVEAEMQEDEASGRMGNRKRYREKKRGSEKGWVKKWKKKRREVKISYFFFLS